MEQLDLEKLIGELEIAVDRLRSLYEQYFMGIEKLEPTVPRKDVDRRIHVLRKEQIRNTALRFRFQMLLQRYNTYQTHWQRICREIENGTYKRHLLRAERRFADRRRSSAPPPPPVSDVPPVLTGQPPLNHGPGAAGAVPPAALPHAPSVPGIGGIPAMPPLTDAMAAELAELDAEFAPAPGVRAPHLTSQSFAFDDDEPPTPGRGSSPQLPRPAPAPQPAPPPNPPAARVGAPPVGVPGAPPRPPPLPPASRSLGPMRPPAATLPGVGAPPPPPPSRPAVPAPPRAPGPPPPGSATRLAGNPPVAPPASAPRLEGTTAAPSAPKPVGAPPAPPPSAPKPVGAPPAPPPSAPRVERAVPPPAPSAPRIRPADPPARPAPAAPPEPIREVPLADERVRELYTQYVEAKRRQNESTAAVTYDAVAKTLRDSQARIQQKHGRAVIDFEVAVKDGKAILKPVVK